MISDKVTKGADRAPHRSLFYAAGFTDDELNLMMIYNPGSREGLIAELTQMQSQLTGRDKELRRWTKSVLSKLSAMSDEAFSSLELLP